MRQILIEFLQACRALKRRPGFFIAALATLTLGLGAVITLFTAIYGLVLKPLPYPASDRMATFRMDFRDGDPVAITSIPLADRIRQEASSVEDLALYKLTPTVELGGFERPEAVPLLEVSWNFLPFIGAKPLLGSGFAPEHEQGDAPFAMLTFEAWQRYFQGRQDVLGQSLRINGQTCTLVGVTPQNIVLPGNIKPILFRPLSRKDLEPWSFFMTPVIRLKQGATLAQFQADAQRLCSALATENQIRGQYRVDALGFQEELLGDRSLAMLLLLGASSLLLLIACANVASLFLARAMEQRHELSLRAALGAGSSRIFRQLFLEGLAVGLPGCILALALAFYGIKGLPLILPQAESLTGIDALRINPVVTFFALGLGIFTSLLFATLPALQARRLDLNRALLSATRGGTSAGKRSRALLVMAESALCVAMLAMSGLFMHSLLKTLNTHPGFNAKNLLSFKLALPGLRYPSPESKIQFKQDLLHGLKGLPGVQSAAIAREGLMGGASTALAHSSPTEVGIEGWSEVAVECVSPRYLATLQTPLLKGREFASSDMGISPQVAILNEKAARLLFPGVDPIGRRLRFTSQGDGEWEVIGLCGDIRQAGLKKDALPQILVPITQFPTRGMTVLLRTDQKPGALQKTLEARIKELDPNLPIQKLGTVEDLGRKGVADQQQITVLLGVFAGLGLLISALGIGSVVSYGVAQRRREIGIRMALGASLRQILGLVMSQSLIQVGIGALCGAALSLAMSRMVQSQIHGVEASNPVALSASLLIFTAVAALASLIPALKAARVQPVEALKSE